MFCFVRFPARLLISERRDKLIIVDKLCISMEGHWKTSITDHFRARSFHLLFHYHLLIIIDLIRAPTDCVQYFTGTAGQIYSYNFGQMLGGMYYTNCIRTEVGYILPSPISSIIIPGRLLRRDVQGGEQHNPGRVQLAPRPVDHHASRLPRLLCLHPKIEVTVQYVELS